MVLLDFGNKLLVEQGDMRSTIIAQKFHHFFTRSKFHHMLKLQIMVECVRCNNSASQRTHSYCNKHEKPHRATAKVSYCVLGVR